MRDRKAAEESPVNAKFKLGRSISSANITSKNGYLFVKRIHGSQFCKPNGSTLNDNFSKAITS